MNITRAWLAFISGTLITLLALNVAAQSQVVSAHEQLDRQTLIMRVYVRPGCPHCTAAKEYLPSLARQFPQLQVVYRDVSHDSNARDELIALFRERQQWPPSVPTFVIGDGLLSGFGEAATSGPKLAELIQGQQLQQRIESSIFGELSVERLGLPLFTLAIGLLDGFTPAPCGYYFSCCRCWCTSKIVGACSPLQAHLCWSAAQSTMPLWPLG